MMLSRLHRHGALLRTAALPRLAMRMQLQHHEVLPLARAMSSSSSSSNNGSAGFEELGLHANLVTALQEMGITSPTGIQRKSIPAILSRKDILCTAQTGTGKTLSYMAPVVEQLHREELSLSHEQKQKTLASISRPQVLVVLPSRELALQVGDVAKKLAHSVKFASCTVTSGERKSLQQKSLGRHLDMVIGTPGRLAKCIEKGDLYVSRIHTVIIDEADTLLDAKMGFRKELDHVLNPIQASVAKRNKQLQVVLVAATIRSPLDQVVKKKFGDLRLVSDDKIHQTPSTLREEFIRTSPENKQSALRDALHMRRFKHAKTMIFCRNAASCRATDHMLRENGFKSLCLHGDMPAPLREASSKEFHHNEQMNILVCTDLAARGLHFDHVKHIIMCDFPQSAVDYVHRAGRAGRAGEEGFVTSLVTKGDIDLAKTIEESKKNRKTIKSLRSDGNKAVETVEEYEDEAEDGQDQVVDDERVQFKTTMKASDKKTKAMKGHGTKRLKKYKLRKL